MDKTFFMLKPDAMPYETNVLILLDSKLTIIEYKRITLSEHLFKKIYAQIIRDPSIPALKEYLNENSCGIGIVNSSIDSLIELSGKNTAPQHCESYTIRFMYGGGWGYTKSGLRVLRNAIHRPKTVEQNTIQVELLYDGVI